MQSTRPDLMTPYPRRTAPGAHPMCSSGHDRRSVIVSFTPRRMLLLGVELAREGGGGDDGAVLPRLRRKALLIWSSVWSGLLAVVRRTRIDGCTAPHKPRSTSAVGRKLSSSTVMIVTSSPSLAHSFEKNSVR